MQYYLLKDTKDERVYKGVYFKLLQALSFFECGLWEFKIIIIENICPVWAIHDTGYFS